MYTKAIFTIGIFLFAIGFIFCGNSETETQKPDIATATSSDTTASDTTSAEMDTTSIKVTFIELGSVNCVPCKMMQPIMEDIEKEYDDQVDVVFYDVWTEAGKPYATQYKISAIPTQVFLDKDGKEYARHVGFFPKEKLLKVLEKGGVKLK